MGPGEPSSCLSPRRDTCLHSATLCALVASVPLNCLGNHELPRIVH